MDFDTLFNHIDDETHARMEREFSAHDHTDGIAGPLHLVNPATPSPEHCEWQDQLPGTGDFERCVRFAEPLVIKYDDISSAEWELSPLGWIRQVSSAHKRGKIGEELVAAWAHSEGIHVSDRRHRGHDCLLDGLRIEVKTSLRWNNDRFVFFGIKDFQYDAVAFLGVEPDNVRLWIVPKQLVMRHARDQLRGAEALGSKWISFYATQPPEWLEPWGGSFSQARRALRDAAAYKQEGSSDKPPSPHGSTDEDAWLQLAAQIDWPWHSNPEHHLQPQPTIKQTQRNDSHVND